nr:hypothetical protein [uncultured Deefgea sp.]
MKIKLITFFIVFFSSLNVHAYGLWQSRQSGLVRIGSLLADCRATTAPMYDSLISNTCNDDFKSSCYIQYYSNSQGMRSTCNYAKVSEAPDPTPAPTPEPDKCLSKAQTKVGNVYAQIAGAIDRSTVVSDPVIVDKAAMVQQRQNMNYTSCVDGCKTIAIDVGIKNNSGGYTYGFVGDRIVYGLFPSQFTGAQCKTSDTKDPSKVTNAPPQVEPPKAPQSQNDCPSGTTFGQVNNVPVCVKNAPAANASGVPQYTADDGKACLGNCDGWKPTGQPDTSNGKEGTGQGVDGDGQQIPDKSGGGTADKTIESKDENGDPVTAPNAGFSDINQDKIYASKYKNKSFGSIWDDKKDALMGTPFIASLKDSFPKFGNTGTAPVFSISFSGLHLGQANGAIPIDPRIFAFIKAIFIISACFTARQIIW